MKKVNFISIAPNQIKFEYKGYKFMLEEKSQGVYSIGKSILLYQLDGLDKKYIKCVGNTRSDNHGGPKNDPILRGIVTVEDCKPAALKYIDDLLG